MFYGGGDESMLPKTLFSVKTLNVISCARYVYVGGSFNKKFKFFIQIIHS